MAENRGYKATPETPTADGKGRVDVCLERNGKRIAVEIKDKSKEEWELQNIQKCLNDGYDVVIECLADLKAIGSLTKKVKLTFSEDDRKKIHVLDQDGLVLFLDTEIANEATTDVRTKGRRVKVRYNAVPESEMAKKRDSVAKSVIDSLKEKKK